MTIHDHAGAARDRQLADERALELESDQAVVRARGQVLAEEAKGLATVEVIGVGDGKGSVRSSEDSAARTASTVPRSSVWWVKVTRWTLGPEGRDVLLDLGTRVGIDHDDNVVEARGEGV